MVSCEINHWTLRCAITLDGSVRSFIVFGYVFPFRQNYQISILVDWIPVYVFHLGWCVFFGQVTSINASFDNMADANWHSQAVCISFYDLWNRNFTWKKTTHIVIFPYRVLVEIWIAFSEILFILINPKSSPLELGLCFIYSTGTCHDKSLW